MSTMKVTNLKHESSSVNNIVLNSDGSVGGELSTALASKLDLAGGKILQIVRATDSTDRSTTSTSYVDVTGMSVTITPQKNDSAILIAAVFQATYNTVGTGNVAYYRISDSSNNAISGAEEAFLGVQTVSSGLINSAFLLWGWSTPATTSATTYKLRFKVSSGTGQVSNSSTTGQMYAIEVSA